MDITVGSSSPQRASIPYTKILFIPEAPSYWILTEGIIENYFSP
jgi:hypothetical protein